MTMVSLPYDFDTTQPWQRIVKIVFAGAAVLLASTGLALATSNYAGAAGLGLCLAVGWLVVRRARGFPMGAAGRLTANGVEVRGVRVLWYDLPVPVGHFSP